MKIINKQLQLTVKESLLLLEVNTQCLQDEADKKGYIRGEINKVQKENKGYKYRTKVQNGMINVWRIS